MLKYYRIYISVLQQILVYLWNKSSPLMSGTDSSPCVNSQNRTDERFSWGVRLLKGLRQTSTYSFVLEIASKVKLAGDAPHANII